MFPQNVARESLPVFPQNVARESLPVFPYNIARERFGLRKSRVTQNREQITPLFNPYSLRIFLFLPSQKIYFLRA